MPLFSDLEQERITNAIANAEKSTSGEIRVAIEKYCKGDVIEVAAENFNKLGMQHTAKKNGVLIYLASEDHKFAIIGDSGINKLVPADFWETTKTAMLAHFAKGNLVDGIIAGVALAGEKLALFFPYEVDDVNELPNDIVFIDKLQNK